MTTSLEAVYRQLHHIFKMALNDPYPADLGRVFRLMSRLGHPQRAFPCVIVTGSKGKGSTATFLASLLDRSGLKVGLFTGPHLHTYRERIKLNGQDVTPEEFAGLFEEVWQAIRHDPAQEFISRFEIITAMAMLHFRRAGVDLAVMEVGLGGRFDAVNVAGQVPLSVFTPIEMEHVRNLGPTIENIVYHKSGIMRPNGHALTSRQTGPVKELLAQAAAHLGLTIREASERWKYREGSLALHFDPPAGELWQQFEATGPSGQTQLLRTTLTGTFQVGNALTALAAMDWLAELGLSATPSVAALQPAFIPGRFELAATSPPLILDAAHTPNAMRELVQTLAGLGGTPVWVLGFLRDKMVGDMLGLLPLAGQTVFLCDITSHPVRNAPASYVLAQLQQAPARITGHLPLDQALEAARAVAAATPGGYVCVTGSLYLVAAARACLGLLDPATAQEASLLDQIERE